MTRGRVTVHPEYRQFLGELYPAIDVLHERWVDDPLVLSCAGGSGAFDCALSVSAIDLGDRARDRVSDYLLIPGDRPKGPVDDDPADRSKPRTGGAGSAARLIEQAKQIMRAHIEEPVSVPAIAATLGVHQRTLERAFRAAGMGTPLGHFLDLRLGRTQELLTQTTLPMLEVALACGFGSAANFSRVFKRRFGLTPTRHRQRGKVAFEVRFLSEGED